jgi:hypothetical protein
MGCGLFIADEQIAEKDHEPGDGSGIGGDAEHLNSWAL